MTPSPFFAINFSIPDLLMIFSFYKDGNSQPLDTLRCFNFIAVTPVSPRILHIVVEDKLINCRNKVEIPLPRNIIGLKNGDLFHKKNFSLLDLKNPNGCLKSRACYLLRAPESVAIRVQCRDILPWIWVCGHKTFLRHMR